MDIKPTHCIIEFQDSTQLKLSIKENNVLFLFATSKDHYVLCFDEFYKKASNVLISELRFKYEGQVSDKSILFIALCNDNNQIYLYPERIYYIRPTINPKSTFSHRLIDNDGIEEIIG